MMVNRLKKKLHKLKGSTAGISIQRDWCEATVRCENIWNKENNLLFYVDDKGSRSQVQQSSSFDRW